MLRAIICNTYLIQVLLLKIFNRSITFKNEMEVDRGEGGIFYETSFPWDCFFKLRIKL